MNLEEFKDRDELRAFLMNDRLASAYLLGNLDPAYFQWCKVFGTRDHNSNIESLVMVYKGLALPVVFTAGNENDAANIFNAENPKLPHRFQFHVTSQQLKKIKRHFKLDEHREMIRMGLHRNEYTPVDCDTSHIRKLGHRDTCAIMEIYQHYPDHLFTPSQLESGFYYGIPKEHSLLSIAGIHVFSKENEIALIGNFVTHPEHRGKGHATACTSVLLDALLKEVPFVALNVPADNKAAIHLFEKFGFKVHNLFHEGIVHNAN